MSSTSPSIIIVSSDGEEFHISEHAAGYSALLRGALEVWTAKHAPPQTPSDEDDDDDYYDDDDGRIHRYQKETDDEDDDEDGEDEDSDATPDIDECFDGESSQTHSISMVGDEPEVGPAAMSAGSRVRLMMSVRPEDDEEKEEEVDHNKEKGTEHSSSSSEGLKGVSNNVGSTNKEDNDDNGHLHHSGSGKNNGTVVGEEASQSSKPSPTSQSHPCGADSSRTRSGPSTAMSRDDCSTPSTLEEEDEEDEDNAGEKERAESHASRNGDDSTDDENLKDRETPDLPDISLSASPSETPPTVAAVKPRHNRKGEDDTGEKEDSSDGEDDFLNSVANGDEQEEVGYYSAQRTPSSGVSSYNSDCRRVDPRAGLSINTAAATTILVVAEPPPSPSKRGTLGSSGGSDSNDAHNPDRENGGQNNEDEDDDVDVGAGSGSNPSSEKHNGGSANSTITPKSSMSPVDMSPDWISPASLHSRTPCMIDGDDGLVLMASPPLSLVGAVPDKAVSPTSAATGGTALSPSNSPSSLFLGQISSTNGGGGAAASPKAAKCTPPGAGKPLSNGSAAPPLYSVNSNGVVVYQNAAITSEGIVVDLLNPFGHEAKRSEREKGRERGCGAVRNGVKGEASSSGSSATRKTSTSPSSSVASSKAAAAATTTTTTTSAVVALSSESIALCVEYIDHFALAHSSPTSSCWSDDAPTALPIPLTAPLASLLSSWECDFLYTRLLSSPEGTVEAAKAAREVCPSLFYCYPGSSLGSEDVRRAVLMPIASTGGVSRLTKVMAAATLLQIGSLRELCLAWMADYMIRAAYGAEDNFAAAHLIRQCFKVQGDWTRREMDCLKVENEWPANEEE